MAAKMRIAVTHIKRRRGIVMYKCDRRSTENPDNISSL
jgi:hypothetical protein